MLNIYNQVSVEFLDLIYCLLKRDYNSKMYLILTLMYLNDFKKRKFYFLLYFFLFIVFLASLDILPFTTIKNTDLKKKKTNRERYFINRVFLRTFYSKVCHFGVRRTIKFMY